VLEYKINHMKKLIYPIIAILLIATSCSDSSKHQDVPPPLFPQPQTVALNTNGGYITNAVTGDTIQPIILENGDTLKTGVPIPATPKIIHPDSVTAPKVVKAATELVVVNAHPNRHKIPKDLPSIPVDRSQLKTIKVGEGNPDFVLVNSIGDTIPTGIPIPSKGKTLSIGEGKGGVIQPKPIKALPPATKDAAIANIQYLDVDQGMKSSYVFSILEDKSGNLWFGTSGGGVSKYDGESFVHFTEKEGLSNNRVYSILETKNTKLNSIGRYITTENGLNYLVRVSDADGVSTPNEKGVFSIQNFGKNDGLKGLDFFENSALIDSKNRAWWGSGKGLEMLDLNTFKLSDAIPQPRLTGLDINEQFIDYRNMTDSLGNEITFTGVPKFENYPLNLSLPYDKNHLTFHFVAIDWAAPHKIQYTYLLEGLDKTWSQPTQEPKAEYRNLSYGTYTFKIRAIGESGQWSEPFEYTFTIHPPWWHTWWARSVYGLLALTLILALIQWRTKSLRERQKQLEQTVQERTAEVVEEKKVVEQQKHLIEEKHKEITDSINYAERIQRSFLASCELLDEHLRDYFVFFQPKDIVSGDFYWASPLKNGNFAFCCADSTGHGVPGAIMSILNISSLEKAIEKESEPHKILNKTRELIINRLKKDGSPEGGKDGMDCSLLVINQDKTQLTFASANNPVFIVRAVNSSGRPEAAVSRSDTHELLEYKPDKMPVGKHDKDQEPFTLQTVPLQPGDVIYTLTDGFPDQFGGEKGKKYMIKNLKELFLQIAHLPMHEQERKLTEELTIWKGGNEQIDDICIIGVRIQ